DCGYGRLTRLLHASSTLSLTFFPSDALPISCIGSIGMLCLAAVPSLTNQQINSVVPAPSRLSEFVYQHLKHNTEFIVAHASGVRSEEHTSELQSRENHVCRLLLEKKIDNIM